MYRYLFISILMLCSLASAGQGRIESMGNAMGVGTTSQGNSQKTDDDEERPVEPKITVIKDQGLALGVDVLPVITRFFNDENTGIAFVGRYGFKNFWWANAELGYQHTKYESGTGDFKYKSDGTFIKIGLDYDIFNNEDFPVNDNIFVGFRYGYAWQNQEADRYRIVDSYWGNYEGSVGRNAVNSHMMEVLFGLRCEMVRNLYMGWSVRGRFLLASKGDGTLDPYSVPGYGKYDAKAGIGFSYTIEYQIPFNKLGKHKRAEQQRMAEMKRTAQPQKAAEPQTSTDANKTAEQIKADNRKRLAGKNSEAEKHAEAEKEGGEEK